MDFDTDSECSSDVDEQTEIFEELTAALEEDDDLPCDTMSHRLSHLPSSRTSPGSCRTANTNCTSSALAQIDLALSANKILDEKMRRLERDLTIRLKECRQKLQVIQGNSNPQADKTETFRYISCGRPYFKDRLNFPAPDNDDAKMAKSQMYDFSLVISVPGWTVRDKSQFVNMIHKMSIDIKKNELLTKITALKRKHKSINKNVEKEIMALRKEIDKVNKKPLSEVALPIDKEYDWDMLANKLNRRHTAQEYQSLWKLFFHPSINKNSWSKAEHAELQKIASQNKQQDWDNIARKLNTGRTGYQCFVYYRTNMTNSFSGKKWTNEEITYLKRLIDYFKEDNYIPWGKIAAAMENRTKIQIYNKYMRLIEQRKGRFLPEEDAVILNCVERFGTNFRRMTDYLPGRSMVQIRARYQVLSKMRVSTVWTVEDDKKLIQIMNNHDSTMNFSIATQHFPGRNRIKIRSRYVTLMKWMKKHPNLDLEHAPRRGARRLNHGQASDNLNAAIENLKNTLNTEVEIKAKKKKMSKISTHLELDDAIYATLLSSIIKEREVERKRNNEENQLFVNHDQAVTQADLNATNLRKIIIFLNASLNQNEFTKSKYTHLYPDLGAGHLDVSLVKVKSYSKKTNNRNVKVNERPNIWGNPTLGQRNYVYPPNLGNITGCRVIMKHVASMTHYCESINLHVLLRRNVILKEQLDIILERFFILFTWPMLLSNEGPSENNDEITVIRKDIVCIKPHHLPHSPEIAINVKCIKKFKNLHTSEVIDLDEDEENKAEVTIKEKLVSRNEKITKIEKLLLDE